MRFDEFVARNGVAVSPVDRFDGFAVDVGAPPDWEPFDATVGVGARICRGDSSINEFCTNAVLTLHRVEVSLDAGEVFAMLSEQQMQSVSGCHELHRELAAATEGPGGAGTLVVRISHELGTIDSVSRSRIIPTEQATLIAQLTVTSLHDSTVDRQNIWLAVRQGAAGRSSAGFAGGAPASRNRDGR
ncbi:hypothetical protein [Mycolicibacter senuensis]|uniref:hypothetical protein n=1 Tax=Mycolicibacter senuensis TaxID=386913 RepID=UPI000DCB72AE|nr:hypothetical protein [Mycolicibacter senuensis]RAU96330.1 hypothetical protein DQP56_15110 [Mycolicibacter senuensis]